VQVATGPLKNARQSAPPAGGNTCATGPAGAGDPPCPSQEQITTGPLKGGLRESALPSTGNVEIDTDQAITSIPDDTTLLKGNVVLRQGAREVKGEELEYNRRTNSVKTDSRIEYVDPLVRLTGNEGGSYSPDQGGNFKASEFELRQRSARGTAQSMQWSPEGVLRMQGVTFSTCPKDNESWRIRASSVLLDTESKIGSAHGATIDFQGVPILWLPKLSFPLSTERKSGFLFPVVGQTSQSGAFASAPVYWNIAPNFDFTFEPTYYTLRNEDLAGDFRYLTESSHGGLQWNYLPRDSLYKSQYNDGEERSRIRFTDVTELPGTFRLSLQGDNVSDSHYFENFAQGPEGTATAFLDRAALVSYRDEHWRFDGEAENYQTVDSNLPLEERPYTRLPRVALDGDFGWGPGELLRYGFQSEAVRFDRSLNYMQPFPVLSPPATCAQTAVGCFVTGWRFNVTPQASLNFGGPGYFVHPTVGYSATQYELNNVIPNVHVVPAGSILNNTPRLLLPFASFDTGLVFERDSGANAQRTLTLEPRLMYLYAPFRDQSQLPVFDTELPDLNPIQLFRMNRFVGGDRFGDANQVTAALTSRLFDSASGEQFLSATVGQAYYFVRPQVTLLPTPTLDLTSNPPPPNPNSTPQPGRSDFIAQLQLTAFQHWSADYGLQWNPENSTAVREYVNLQYRPAPTRVVNLSWRFEQGSVDQVELSTAWPVTHSWNIFLREIYSLRTEIVPASTSPGPGLPPSTTSVTIPPKPLETFVGLEYRSCCWGVRMGGRQFVSAFNGTQSSGVFLELELMGFASVGSASDTVLMENIRGYVPPNARVPQNFVPPAFP
jgi:LPS-assembly protein